jgi:hypothetical protein
MKGIVSQTDYFATQTRIKKSTEGNEENKGRNIYERPISAFVRGQAWGRSVRSEIFVVQ